MRRSLATTVAVAVLLATTACGGSGGPAEGEDPYGESAMRYGQAPTPHPDVTLQPDVIIVGGGGRSIRSVTSDGFTWRLDADADRADELTPGKIMFVTGRAVGRVLRLDRDGSDLLVTIGPVNITDVIRNGSFARDRIVLDDPIAYQAGDPFWADPAAASGGTGGGTGAEPPAPGARLGRTTPVRVPQQAAPPGRPAQPPPTRGKEVTIVNANFFTGATLTDGADLGFYYNRDGVKLAGRVTLTFERTVDAGFHLNIEGGAVTRADLTIGGGFGVKVAFEAGIRDGQNIRAVLPVPVEFSFPIGVILGVPLSLTIGQTLKVTTAFGAKLGTVEGSGEFTLAGSLGYGYANGVFGPRVSTDVQRKKSLIESLTGVPVGVMGLLIEHAVTFTVGFNAFVLKAGVFFEISTAYGTTLGSGLGAVGTLGTHFVECRGVGLGMYARYGVGYTILAPVANLINDFLSLLSVKPIPAEDKIGPPPHKLWSSQEITPDVPLCTPPTPA
nr:hypothetical protein [Micromonospora sp. DSM 115978]